MTNQNEASPDPEQLKKILVVREHARADALLRKDRRALDALLAPDFIEINTMGRFDRTGVLDTLFPAITLRVFTISDPHLQPLSDADNAVLTYRCYEEMTAGEKEIKGIFTVTAHYRKNKTLWQLVKWEIAG
jgi:hypothetical protein